VSNVSGQRSQLVVFDLGGTTLQDDGAILSTFIQVAHEHGLEVTPEYVEAQLGKTKRELYHVLTSLKHRDEPAAADYLANKANAKFEAQLTEHYSSTELRLLRGTIETFEYLRQHDVKVAITSGFWRAILNIILERTGLGALVDASVATDEVTVGKPAPYMIFRAMELCEVFSVRRVVAVGDTPLDCLAGCNAGCGYVVGVLTGTHEVSSLEKAPHNYIIDSAARVRELFEAGKIR
jgi:phosphonatase-like hydrolase